MDPSSWHSALRPDPPDRHRYEAKMWIRTTPTRCRRASEGRTPSLHEDPDGRRDALGERERKVAAGHRGGHETLGVVARLVVRDGCGRARAHSRSVSRDGRLVGRILATPDAPATDSNRRGRTSSRVRSRPVRRRGNPASG
jgi:hypothetical protein